MHRGPRGGDLLVVGKRRRAVSRVLAGLGLLMVAASGCDNGSSGVSDWQVGSGRPIDDADDSTPVDGAYPPGSATEASDGGQAGAQSAPVVAELDAIRVPAGEAGVPDTWTVVDYSPETDAETLESDDALVLQGVGTCADGTLMVPRPDDRAWMSRRFTSPDDEGQDGLVQVELLVERFTGDSIGELAVERERWNLCNLPGGFSIDVGVVRQSPLESGDGTVPTMTMSITEGSSSNSDDDDTADDDTVDDQSGDDDTADDTADDQSGDDDTADDTEDDQSGDDDTETSSDNVPSDNVSAGAAGSGLEAAVAVAAKNDTQTGDATKVTVVFLGDQIGDTWIDDAQALAVRLVDLIG